MRELTQQMIDNYKLLVIGFTFTKLLWESESKYLYIVTDKSDPNPIILDRGHSKEAVEDELNKPVKEEINV